uniref:Uncharacterized protein n=1 Tax=Panagrolaimus sp. JU765 TaxID=591449 RepID=A0AC34Q0Q4_9BILA
MIFKNLFLIGFLIDLIGNVESLALSLEQSVEALACSRNPGLPYCKAFEATVRDRREDKEKDAVACRELRTEYISSCTRDKISTKNDEFCNAYENVCFRIPNGEPDQPATTRKPRPRVGTASVVEEVQEVATEAPKVPRKDYTEFCKEYKQRFLYVCPDPFRFGQRAAVFCPIYSERCNVPVPEKPVPPTQRPPISAINEALTNRQRVCASYRAQVDTDPSCKTLMEEFRAICFAPPSKGAVDETLAFCEAFRDSCKNTVSAMSIPKPKDVGKYCDKHRERFRYVCPDPTRFGKYSPAAIEFCPRYQSFCPNEELPTEPEMFTEKVGFSKLYNK